MPRLVDRATGTLGDIAPKAVGLLSVTGFAAAGVVSVIAENLRTLADREEALPDRAKQVAQNSIGAVLAGPNALSQRGRQLVGKDGTSGNGAGTTAHRAGTQTSRDQGGTAAPKPAERPTRSKPEEARVRDEATAGASAGRDETGDRSPAPDTARGGGAKTPPRAIDTSSAEAATETAKPASRAAAGQRGASKREADARKRQTEEAAAKAKEQARRAQEKTEAAADTAADTAKSAADKAANAVKGTADTAKDTAKSTADKAKDTAKRTADRTEDRAEEAAAQAEEAGEQASTAETSTAKKSTAKKSTAKKSTAGKSTAKESAEATSGTADPDRSVEEQRAAQKAAKKQAGGKGGNGQDADEAPEGVPAGVDEHLVADLQRMTVKQLRDRAAQDGVAGRSDMNKDELVVALATRETDDVPAKA